LVFFTLFIASQVLGLIHEYSFGFAGYFDINSTLFIMFHFAVLMSFRHIGELKKSLFAKHFIVLLPLYVYALIYPWVTGLSSLLYCVKASKEFAMYFCYFAVFLFIRTERQVNMSWVFIGCLAVYYSLLEVLGGLFHGYLFSFLQYSYQRERINFPKIYLPIFTIMVAMFFNRLHKLLFRLRSVKNVLVLSIYSLGVLLTFFRAYILASVFTVPLLLFLKGNSRKAVIATTAIALIIPLSLLVLVPLTSKSYEEIFDSFIGSGITELYHYEGGSLRGRDAVSAGRLELVKQKLWTGWGFVAWDSEIGKKIRPKLGYDGRTIKGGTELGFIDKGYLDVAAKFGIIGSILLYGSFVTALFKLIKVLRASNSIDFNPRAFACAALIIVFLCVQFTHAPLTRQFGIIPLSIVMALVDRQYVLLSGTLNS